MQSQILSEIGKKSLVDVVPGLSSLIVDKGKIVVIEKNQELVQQGEPIRDYLMPISGGLRLFESKGSPARRVPAGYVQKHRTLGLAELLQGKPWAHTAVAEAVTSVLVLPKDAFLRVVESTPHLTHYLKLVTLSSAVRNFKDFLSDHKVTHADVLRLVAKIIEAPVPLAKGTEVTDHTSLWFVTSGQLRVTGEGFGMDSTVIGEGAFFGGECLVTPFEWSYEVAAEEPTVLQRMPGIEARALFNELRLVEPFYDEPWLKTKEEQATRIAMVAAQLTPLPGHVLDENGLAALGFGLDFSNLRRAATDRHCNVASVANLMAFLRIPTNTSSLETELRSQRALTMLRIAEIIEPYGVYAKSVGTKLSDLAQHDMPALAAVGPRLMTLLRVDKKKKQVILHDPARGFVQIAFNDFAKVWHGSLLEVSPANFSSPNAVKQDNNDDKADANSPKEEGRPTIALLASIVKGNRKLLMNIGGLSLLSVGLGMVQPFFSQMILDEVLTIKDVVVLRACIVGFVLSSFLMVFVDTCEQLLFAEFATAFDGRLASLFYRSALMLPVRFFSQRKAGDILTRLNELETIREFLSASTLHVAVQLLSVVMYSAILAVFSVPIAMLAIAVGALVIAIQLALRTTLRRNYEQAFAENTRATSLITEQISAIATVKALGAEKAMRERWEKSYLSSRQLAKSSEMSRSAVGSVISLITAVARVAGLWLAVRAAFDGKMSPGQILAVSMYLNQIVGGALAIGGFFSGLARVRVAFNNVRRIMEATPETPPEKTAVTLSLPLKGKIKLERVNFRYRDEADWVLRDLSVTIYPKQVVAIVGRSGCGKTTLAHLIAGNIKPTSGRIFFDSFDSAFVSHSTLRQQIGFIMQSNDLFQATIGENIAFSDDAPAFDTVDTVAREAHATKFIMDMPNNYGTFLAEGGLGLSGGQKQRLSIARTLYRDPKILILDEATSALDAESEQAIVENMREILKGKTSIIIAHRLSTIRHADVILVMRDGAIVEEGSHVELISRGGHYAELFEGQLSEVES